MDVLKEKNLVVIVGPTAIGKTGLSIKLAKKLNCEILSADSRQFYKEMAIGTAKPTVLEMDGVPHHFINHISIQQNYSAGDFEREALQKLEELFKSNDKAILVGGSGLFINAVCNGLDDIPGCPNIRNQLTKEFEANGLKPLQTELKSIDPNYYNEADLQNPRRIMRALEVYRTSGKPYSYFRNKVPKARPFKITWIGLNLERQKVYENINKRVDIMVDNGLIEEVKSLHDFKDVSCLKTVGYQEFYQHPLDTEKAIELVKRNTRRFAKRQITFFKRNQNIKWFEPFQLEEILAYCKSNNIS